LLLEQRPQPAEIALPGFCEGRQLDRRGRQRLREARERIEDLPKLVRLPRDLRLPPFDVLEAEYHPAAVVMAEQERRRGRLGRERRCDLGLPTMHRRRVGIHIRARGLDEGTPAVGEQQTLGDARRVPTDLRPRLDHPRSETLLDGRTDVGWDVGPDPTLAGCGDAAQAATVSSTRSGMSKFA
jgi:hypothetical protein